MTIAVVIPYFQRSEGILASALASVFAQRDVEGVRVVVVDDASPVPAQRELALLNAPTRFPVSVFAQQNAGPAAARNRGLDMLGEDVRLVAFLDSDDTWMPDHLRNATTALAQGHDFYFADFHQPGQIVSAFGRAARLAPAAHPRIAGFDTLHTYQGDMFAQITMGNVIGTSTVVYDFDRFRAQRFDEEFFSAGEDYLFWIACARAGARFCFSSDPEVQYGYGVNVYSGSGWGTEGNLLRVHYEMKYRKRVADRFELDETQRRYVTNQIAQLRIAFVRDVVHRLRHRKPVPLAVLGAQFRLDPATLFGLPITAARIALDALNSRRSSS